MANSPKTGRLLGDIPAPAPDEHVENLLSRPGLRIERIVSHGHASPEDFWYDQDDDEWVMVIEGEAVLQIDGESALRRMRRGDWIHLPAHCRHRVVRTASPTVWLAVHLEA